MAPSKNLAVLSTLMLFAISGLVLARPVSVKEAEKAVKGCLRQTPNR
jgi:hypothetical protein